jgi:hypothetical protein
MGICFFFPEKTDYKQKKYSENKKLIKYHLSKSSPDYAKIVDIYYWMSNHILDQSSHYKSPYTRTGKIRVLAEILTEDEYMKIGKHYYDKMKLWNIKENNDSDDSVFSIIIRAEYFLSKVLVHSNNSGVSLKMNREKTRIMLNDIKSFKKTFKYQSLKFRSPKTQTMSRLLDESNNNGPCYYEP